MPISPYLFILCVELLAINIRESKNVRGIEINGKTLKISQLADDTTCFVADLESVKNFLCIFHNFKLCAGLKVNTEKTKAKALGPLKDSAFDPLGLDWTDPHVNCLGVILNGKESDHYALNYSQRISNLKSLLNTWKCRSLSLKGKVTVINNLALPPLLYVCSIIHTPENVYEEVKTAIIDFIWDGKRNSKIAYNVLIQPIHKGGLKLIDLELKVKALKSAWVKRFLDNNTSKWKAFPGVIYNTIDYFNFFRTNRAHMNVIPLFYKEIQNAWSDASIVNPNSITAEQIKSESLWNNRYITINKNPFRWNTWAQAGINKVSDLLRGNVFIDHEEIERKFNVKCNFFTALQVRQSIPASWRTLLYKDKKHITNTCSLFLDGKAYDIKHITTKLIYNTFINQINRPPTCIETWGKELPTYFKANNNRWSDIFTMPFNTSRETLIQTFQYKILHRLITCQKRLHEMKIAQTDICLYCFDSEDDLKHFFLECPKVKDFWSHFFNWWNGLCDTRISADYEYKDECILFGFLAEGDVFFVLDYCILQAKYYIYNCRIHNNNLVDFFQYLLHLKSNLTIEHEICSTQQRNDEFMKFNFIYDNL